MPDFVETPDFLNNSTSLRKAGAHRMFFDPSLQSHLDSFDQFLKTGNWGEIHFFCESPYSDVPMTVLMKFAMYEQNVKREPLAERTARIAARPNIVCLPQAETPSEARGRRAVELAEVNKQMKASFAKA